MTKITLITGGNKGLGFETAKALINEGHKVYIGSRNESRGQEAAKEIGAQSVQLDVTDETSVQHAFNYIKDQEGRLDVLVNNAGISGQFAKPADITVEDMDKVYQTNVYGIVRMMNTFIPLLEQS